MAAALVCRFFARSWKLCRGGGIVAGMADKHEIRGGVYAVGYFDISGQSNAMLPYIDVEKSDGQEVKDALTRIVRQLHNFRRDIREYFDGAVNESLVDAAPAGVSPDILPLIADYGSPQIKLQGFSDTVVAYVPLGTPKGALSIYGIGSLLISVASTTLTSFARGVVVRGAIDVSWGIEPFAGEFYGPALVSVYRLESNAVWPRVVVGAGILKLWTTLLQSKMRVGVESANREFANIQSSLTFEDVDGQVAVDYLGTTMQDFIAGEVPGFPSLIDAAHVRLESMHDNYSNDQYIQDKLRSALNYFESRVGQLTESRRIAAAAFISKE
jgi:hypothetical protein